MAENQTFDVMPYFMWPIEDIHKSFQTLNGPICTVGGVEFSMLFEEHNGITKISMTPVIKNPKLLPPYSVETSISFVNPVKGADDDFLFTQKRTSVYSTSRIQCHIVWEMGTYDLAFLAHRRHGLSEHVDQSGRRVRRRDWKFLCIFGPLCQYQRDDDERADPWKKATCNEKLMKDISKLFPNKNSPLKLKCGDKTIPVHAVILSARSKKFADMLLDKKVTEKEIEIRDMEPEVLENLITYIYSGKLKNSTPSEKLLKQLYKTAFIYKVEHLQEMASSKLTEFLTEGKLPGVPQVNDKMLLDLSLECLTMADKSKDDIFKTEIISFIVQNKGFQCKENWKLFCKYNPKLAREVNNVVNKD